MSADPTPADRARVGELLGREPQGRYSIAARDAAGDPVVIRNAPFLDDGTPMPTLYWLIGAAAIKRIGRLEAGGGVNAAEADADPAELAAAHSRYAAEREALIPPDHVGPRPHGGVGGTRTGVKCLHAHWAWYLAGGDDPIGRWIATRIDAGDEQPLDAVHVDVELDETVFIMPSGNHGRIPWGPHNLTARWLSDSDPPHPADLTNVLGEIDDHLHDVEREHPEFGEVGRDRTRMMSFSGDTITTLAGLELGTTAVPSAVALTRRVAEELFRVVATESAGDRAHNPGLPSWHVGIIVATCCIVLSVMRRFHLDQVTLATGLTLPPE